MVTRVFTLFGVIFAVIAVVMMTVAGVLLVKHRQFEQHSLTATGTITELVAGGKSCQSNGGDCQPMYAPRVTFATSNGSPFTFVARGFSNPPEYSVGNLVLVRYQALDPKTARIDSAGDLDAVWVTGGIGVGCLGFAALWIVLMRISRRTFRDPDHPAATPIGQRSVMREPDDGPSSGEPPIPGDYEQPPTTPTRADVPSEPPEGYR